MLSELKKLVVELFQPILDLWRPKWSANYTSFFCILRPCNQIVRLACIAKSAICWRAVTGPHYFFSEFHCSGTLDIRGGAGLHQIIRGWGTGAAKALINGRHWSGQWIRSQQCPVLSQKMMTCCAWSRSLMASSSRPRCGSGPPVSPKLALQDGLCLLIG